VLDGVTVVNSLSSLSRGALQAKLLTLSSDGFCGDSSTTKGLEGCEGLLLIVSAAISMNMLGWKFQLDASCESEEALGNLGASLATTSESFS